MLAGMRSRFLLPFVVALCVAACLAAQAQTNGVPPSVTSMGFGGRIINGVPPSVTSIGFGGNFINGVRPSGTSLGSSVYGNGWSVFGDWPLISEPKISEPKISEHHRHRRDHGTAAVGVLEPVYVPYGVPYAPEADDDSVDSDADASYSAAPPPFTKRAGNRNSAPDSHAVAEDPVIAQPSTVLVFKDGHQSDVLNYAIVGDTLFDFAEGRTRKILLADLDLKATRKANDDRGVDFEIPGNITGQ